MKTESIHRGSHLDLHLCWNSLHDHQSSRRDLHEWQSEGIGHRRTCHHHHHLEEEEEGFCSCFFVFHLRDTCLCPGIFPCNRQQRFDGEAICCESDREQDQQVQQVVESPFDEIYCSRLVCLLGICRIRLLAFAGLIDDDEGMHAVDERMPQCVTRESEREGNNPNIKCLSLSFLSLYLPISLLPSSILPVELCPLHNLLDSTAKSQLSEPEALFPHRP